jgi:hypothetical protein
MSGRRAKQLRRLVRMANFGDRDALAMVLTRVSRAKAHRISNRSLDVDSRRAARRKKEEGNSV